MKFLTPAEVEEASANAIEAVMISTNVGLIEGRRSFEVRIGIVGRVSAGLALAGWAVTNRSDWGDYARFDLAAQVAK